MAASAPANRPQRTSPRAPALWTVNLWGAESPVGVCVNVSLGGMALALSSAIPVGTLLRVSAQVPGTQGIHVTAVVVWTREVNGEARVGLRFLTLKPDALAAVNDYVAAAAAA